jgi:hypothetical protein
MELLPALALALGFAAHGALAALHRFKPRWSQIAVGALFAIVAVNAAQMVRERPLTYVEGVKNIEARRAYDELIPHVLRALLVQRPGGVVLMDTSVYPELVAFTGIRLRQTINESDLTIYSDALSAPAEHADLVLAFDGDQIDRAVKAHPEGLQELYRFKTTGQPAGTIYTSDMSR